MEYFLNFIKSSNDNVSITLLCDLFGYYFFHFSQDFKEVKVVHKIFNEDCFISNMNDIYSDIVLLYRKIPMFQNQVDDIISCLMDIKHNSKYILNLKIQISYWSKKYNTKVHDDILKIDDIYSLSIIKNQMFRKKKSIPKTLKVQVWNHYVGEEIGKTLCMCCEKTFITQSNFECGHIIPESKDGKTTLSNLIPICGMCNKSMNNQNLFEFKNKYF